MVLITSADNDRYRGLLKLARSPRERRRTGRTLVDGLHLLAACRDHGVLPDQLVVSASARDQPGVAPLLDDFPGVERLDLADGLFRELSPVDTPAGVLAIIPVRAPPADAGSGPCVLLEDIQDPGNLGSILRSTAAAGVRVIHLSRHCADAWSPRVLRAGMGAHFLLDLYTGADLAEVARRYPGRVIATHQHATRSVFETDLSGDVALAFGNEGAGLSRGLLAAAPTVVAIPMPGRTESLNIAAAAAVCLFERVRQQATAAR